MRQSPCFARLVAILTMSALQPRAVQEPCLATTFIAAALLTRSPASALPQRDREINPQRAQHPLSADAVMFGETLVARKSFQVGACIAPRQQPPLFGKPSCSLVGPTVGFSPFLVGSWLAILSLACTGQSLLRSCALLDNTRHKVCVEATASLRRL